MTKDNNCKLPFGPVSQNIEEATFCVISNETGIACPCCNRSKERRETLNEPCLPGYRRHHMLAQEAIDADKYLLNNISTDSTHSDSSTDSEDEHDELPGVLHFGVEYRPKRILVEGWLHKKGTGKDWFGSRAWKARYCRLVLATVENNDVEVPLFLVYWYPSSDTPSTVISLDSTVIIPVEQEQGAWNQFCFQIIHAKREGDDFKRTFTLARKGRDAWVLSITQALHDYVKRVAESTKRAASSPPPSPPSMQAALAKPIPGIWMEDECVEMAMPSIVSPPSSPRPLQRRPLPRPPARSNDVLVGEAFL